VTTQRKVSQWCASTDPPPCYTVHLVAPAQWLQDLKTYAKQHDQDMNTVVLLAVTEYITPLVDGEGE
jgi:hypothetical protein